MKSTLLLLLLPVGLYAYESSYMLPKRIFRLGLESKNAAFSSNFNGEGENQRIAEGFERNISMLELVSNPADRTSLEALLATNGIDPDLGRIEATTDFKVSVTKLRLHYGLTDNISLGIGSSFWNAESDVNMRFSSTSSAERVLGLNDISGSQKSNLSALFNQTQETINQKFRAVGMQDTGHFEDSGLGDTKLGLKYNYFKTNYIGLASTLSLTVPTGRPDDPNHVHDVGFSEETFVPEFISVQELNLGRIRFSLAEGIRLPLAHTKQMRVSQTGSYFDSSLAEVEEQKGPSYDGQIGTNITTFKDTYLSAHYKYFKQDAGQYSNTAAIGRQGKNEFQEVGGGISYSLISRYQRKKFFAPMDFDLSYRTIVRGTNARDLSAINFSGQLYF